MPCVVASPVPRCLGLLDEHDVGPPRRLLLHLLGDDLGAVTDHERGAFGPQLPRAWMTCRTIARPQIMCSGFGRAERMRVPSPAGAKDDGRDGHVVTFRGV